MKLQVSIQWTETALHALRKLPPKVRRGLLEKAGELRSGDPRKASKPLVGPLAGYYRITYARYRAVYSVQEELLVGGERILHLRVIFIAAGVRKERDKRDIYRIAEKLVRLLPGSQPGQAKELPPEQA